MALRSLAKLTVGGALAYEVGACAHACGVLDNARNEDGLSLADAMTLKEMYPNDFQHYSKQYLKQRAPIETYYPLAENENKPAKLRACPFLLTPFSVEALLGFC